MNHSFSPATPHTHTHIHSKAGGWMMSLFWCSSLDLPSVLTFLTYFPACVYVCLCVRESVEGDNWLPVTLPDWKSQVDTCLFSLTHSSCFFFCSLGKGGGGPLHNNTNTDTHSNTNTCIYGLTKTHSDLLLAVKLILQQHFHPPRQRPSSPRGEHTHHKTPLASPTRSRNLPWIQMKSKCPLVWTHSSLAYL